MLVANQLSNVVETVSLQGLKKARTAEGEVEIYTSVDVHTKQQDAPFVGYAVQVKLAARFPNGDFSYARVEMQRFNPDFLMDAGVDLGKEMTDPHSMMKLLIRTPLVYLSYAIAAIIAARSKLVVSVKEESISLELVCQLPRELRRSLGRGHRSSLPRMLGSASIKDMKSFFRPKKKSRARAA
ncbi:MAG: hypothetical protein Q7N87_03830 [Candidatus Uhrbacteria bacterium]|nr:hypothetical protein [Candidatus Uhrbacteria bacterium]